MHLTIDTILSITGGRLIPTSRNETSFVNGVSIDSRKVGRDSLFICIAGSNVDGHSFVQQSVENGAAAILAERNPFLGYNPIPVIIVSDTMRSLFLMASAAREQTQAKVIGITGTAGKTTVKELLAQLLSTEVRVAKNYLNYNTQIGMSVSMLQAEGNEDAWVMEVGISKPHDMDELGSILKPDIALVLNVGSGHIEGLGEKGVAYHKASLLKYVKDGGTSFVSGDYPDLVREARKIDSNLFLFSIKDEKLSYHSKYIGMSGVGKSIYRLWLDGETLDVVTPFLGRFGAESVIASAAVAHMFGISKENIAYGFSKAELPKQRFSSFQIGSWICIDDSYNANPLSMRKTIGTAFELSEKKLPLIFVLGEMLELGEQTEKEHEELGFILAGTGAKFILWKGGQMDAVKHGLKRGNYTGSIQQVSTSEDLKETLQSCKVDKGIIVFKGSRSNKIELFVDAFTSWVGAH